MSLVRVEVQWIIQGIIDRTENLYYGKGACDQSHHRELGSMLRENGDETLMIVQRVYGNPEIVSVEKNKDSLKIIDKRNGEVVHTIE